MISSIQPLDYSLTVKEALSVMEDCKYSRTPVVKDGLHAGTLMEDDLLDADGQETLDIFKYDLMPFSVNGNDHFLTAAKLTSEQRLKLIPVINVEKEYLGSIVEEDLLRQFVLLNGVQERGALLGNQHGAGRFFNRPVIQTG